MRDITDEAALDEILSSPGRGVVEAMKALDGDIVILGVAGKIGMTLGRMAARAIEIAGVKKRVYGVARFSDPALKETATRWGIEPIVADLLDREAYAGLPDGANVVFMAGKKFGTAGSEPQTWAMNSFVPGLVAERYRGSRIAAFSTGCVYPLVDAARTGCVEATPLAPVGEYAQSCLGRERIFEFFAERYGTPLVLLRLNFAVDLRYGVLFDIASKVWSEAEVDLPDAHFNALWQADANRYALLSLAKASTPALALNITGPETVSIRRAAESFARIMGKEARFKGEGARACYLNDSAKAFSWFGYPEVSMDEMIHAQARWIMEGGRSLGKPTHFEVTNGVF